MILFSVFFLFCGRLWDHNFNRKKDRTAFAIMQSILFKVLTKYGDNILFPKFFYSVLTNRFYETVYMCLFVALTTKVLNTEYVTAIIHCSHCIK